MMDAYPKPGILRAVLKPLMIFIACITVGFALGMLFNVAKAEEPQTKLLGVAYDTDGALILFFDTPPAAMPDCKGGEARKAGQRVGCWVAIPEERVFFVMWSHGDLSNVHQSEVRLCGEGSYQARKCLP